MKKIALRILLVVLLFVGAAALVFFTQMAPILNGIAAKNLCSAYFVAGINEEQAKAEDLGFFPVNLANAHINTAEKWAESSLLGLGTRQAVYRKGLGCTLVNDIPKEELQAKSLDLPKNDALANYFDLVDTVEVLNTVQQEKVNEALNWAFVEEEGKVKNTRGAAIIYKGQLVAEKYAEGIDKNTRLLGWSCTKSLTASIIGLLENEGKLKLTDPAPIPGWKGKTKGAITIQHLLQMNSGLSFNEDYGSVSDVTQMLFLKDSMGLFAASRELAYPPGEVWNYASGTTNIVAYLSSRYFDKLEDYQRYPYEHIFAKLGMSSMLIETDGAGFFIGSSYAYATARDWAKIGLCYLQNGQFNGEQVIPSEWVDYVQQPAAGSEQNYGGHFWLNAGGRYPDVPKSMYSMNGFQGQRVIILPEQELVIVRFGLTYKRGDFDFNYWISEIIEAVEA